MAINSSFPQLAEEVLRLNDNVVNVLASINTMISGNENTVTLDIVDSTGNTRQLNLPSFGYLKGEIDRLSNNLNSIYSINDAGSLIQPSNGTKFRKVVTVDLNREPNDLGGIGILSTFISQKNWFFDGLLNPQLFVEVDLTGQIENNVRKVLCRRYILQFAQDFDGNFTPLGQAALNSFNSLFRNQNQFTLDEFLNWHANTPGLIDPTNPNYDEQLFDLEPNYLELDGLFSMVRTEEDFINRKLWYVVNTLQYIRNARVGTEVIPEVRSLKIGDEMIINTAVSSTRYRILEISTELSYPRLRFERVEGIEPIPIGDNIMKIYSPVQYNKRVRISIGYNERNIIFLKSMNMDNYIMSKNWSFGLGFWTNDLREVNSSLSMEQYYTDTVYDYGEVLNDLVAKKTSNKSGALPNVPVLNLNNFKVSQINKHLTDTPDSERLKTLHNQQRSLKSEVDQIEKSIKDKLAQSKFGKTSTDAVQKQIKLDLDVLNKNKESKLNLLSSVTSQLMDLSRSPQTTVEPKFRIRGFWEIPAPVVGRGTMPQEVVQFRVQYRYLSKDGRESPIDTIKFQTGEGTTQTAATSNWQEYKTEVRKRSYDKSTGMYTWQTEDISNADTPNVNQIDIPIQANEQVEVRVKSISEVGWPESPVESNWSESIIVEFPEGLSTVMNENTFIMKEADKEDLRVAVQSNLSARGLDDHLSDQITVNGVNYFHNSDSILSGFKDENGLNLDLFAYLQRLQTRIVSLEEKIKRVKGELEVIIFRNSDQFVIKNGSELNFNVECEDYLDPYTASGVPTGRVYANNIYVIKDFLLKIRNKSIESPLGLLSNRIYTSTSNSDVYNPQAPQVFWVNPQGEILVNEVSGTTKTQIDNQFIWCVNYDKVDQTSVSRLGFNIGNSFITVKSNSLVQSLSSEDYNIGYGENSLITFLGNNNSLLDSSKWIEKDLPTAASTTKLLSTIHPQVQSFSKIQETNSDKVKSISGGAENDIDIPINIYFKMNSLDPTQTSLNYNYINLNQNKINVRHVKKLKFLLENEAENRPFVFTLKFTLNRSKTIVKKALTNTSTNLSS